MTDIGGQNLEGEIVTAIKDIAGKKAVLATLEKSLSARKRRRRILWSLSGAAALTCVSLSFFLLSSPEPASDGGGIRGGELASDEVERLIEAGRYDEAMELIGKARADLTIDEDLSEEAQDYQRQVIDDERRKLDSLENYLGQSR